MAGKIEGPVRIAIIGSGGISGAHARGYLKYSDKIKCVALCDIVEDRLKKRSEQLGGISRQFKDWKVMLKEMASELDAVDICLPHHLHAPAILDAAAAGKHIICEKPMCISLAEADQIAAAVSKAGITYMSSHNQLFHPVIVEAKRMIDAGELGRVFWIRSQDCFWARGPRANWGWRAEFAKQGGGELIDTGYHPSYRLLHLAGAKPVSVHAQFGRFHNELDGEDMATVQIRFANGTIGEVFTSWACNKPFGQHMIHIACEKGQLFGTDESLFFLPKGYDEPSKRTFEKVASIEYAMGQFADCLREGKRPIAGVEEGRAVLEVILKAAESAKGWQETAQLKI